MVALFHGVLLSIGLILPLGVQNVFIFNQGATQPTYFRVLPVVLTASLCDTFLIILAISGVSLIIFKIVWLKSFFIFFGIIFLLYMGWTIWRATSKKHLAEKQRPLSPKQQISFALSVSLLNPHAILDTVGVIGTSSLAYSGGDTYLFAVGCIVVSWLWFFLLAYLGKLIGKLDSSQNLQRNINRLSAIIIWMIAGLLVYELLF
ncbi:L-lysine exporter family protein LysE/ArgO [Bacillus mesophilus]|uniref:Amino acid transporter n=1 Tax=Bacillus mesophilus TaxID=1808955 RepID=A0A6M0Q5F1_9BACI|nr:L-lysine exporter family protein LysE/ArgO [Bacillus mesophilus]NEY71484.1 amino acid transporter [Bacillus mesophilus]